LNLGDLAAAHESWFRDEANNLPSDAGRAVLDALNAPNQRHVWLTLDNLIEKFMLHESWKSRINDYYNCVF